MREPGPQFLDLLFIGFCDLWNYTWQQITTCARVANLVTCLSKLPVFNFLKIQVGIQIRDKPLQISGQCPGENQQSRCFAGSI